MMKNPTPFPLDIMNYYSKNTIHRSFPYLSKPNNLTSNFWGIYEVGFPEGSHMKAPRGCRVSLWGLSSLPLL